MAETPVGRAADRPALAEGVVIRVVYVANQSPIYLVTKDGQTGVCVTREAAERCL